MLLVSGAGLRGLTAAPRRAGAAVSLPSGVETEAFCACGKSLSFVGKAKAWQNGRYAVCSQARRRLNLIKKGSEKQSDSILFLCAQLLSTFPSTFNCPFPRQERNTALCITAWWMFPALPHEMKALFFGAFFFLSSLFFFFFFYLFEY